MYKIADIVNEMELNGTKFNINRAEKAHQELREYFAKNENSESTSAAEENTVCSTT